MANVEEIAARRTWGVNTGPPEEGASQNGRTLNGTDRLEVVDPWIGRILTVADYTIEKLSESKATGGDGGSRWVTVGLAVLYLLVVVHAAAFGMHLVGDGTVRKKTDRTECLVEWLVERSVAEDRGEPKPSFSPLGCRE